MPELTAATAPPEQEQRRLDVVGALARLMGIQYAARAAGVSVAEAESIGRAEGWPDDMPRLQATWRALRGVPQRGLPAAALWRARRRPAVLHRPGRARPDLSVARVAPLPVRPWRVAPPSGVRPPLADPKGKPPAAPPTPPAAPVPAPVPEDLIPCDVCGIGVTAEYVARTGKNRHGHHREGP